ncbi:MAG: MFS transporter [Clostridiales Family XIII bacterium]|jgi:predicted MFS family arabinose efflux permease|nr:MFS transporter [Clostridiales Family XIII bacterium]
MDNKKPFISSMGQVLPHGYENRMVTILGLAFGFVMFDRFALANLQNYLMEDLGLNYAQLGIASSVFSITWAIVGLFGSWLADTKMSRRKLLMIVILLFSVFSLLTGFVTSFLALVVVRLVMGCFEGTVSPVSHSFIVPQSSDNRRGMNMGLVQVSAVGLISSMLGPIIQVRLAETIGWRYTFAVTIIPGVIIALLVAKFLINPEVGIQESKDAAEKAAPEAPKQSGGDIIRILKERNLLVSLFGAIFLFAWYVCMLIYTPAVLTNVKGLSNEDMSYVMAALGVGAIVWGVVIPKISDVLGRKPLVIFGILLACASTFLLNIAPANVPLLMVLAFLSWSGASVFVLLTSTIPAESGDPRYVATTIAIIAAVGELVGSTVGAIVMGVVADKYGLEVMFPVLAACMIVCFIIACFYKESAPLVVARREAKKSATAK